MLTSVFWRNFFSLEKGSGLEEWDSATFLVESWEYMSFPGVLWTKGIHKVDVSQGTCMGPYGKLHLATGWRGQKPWRKLRVTEREWASGRHEKRGKATVFCDSS